MAGGATLGGGLVLRQVNFDLRPKFPDCRELDDVARPRAEPIHCQTLVEETSACLTLLFPLSVLESCGPIAASKAIAAAQKVDGHFCLIGQRKPASFGLLPVET